MKKLQKFILLQMINETKLNKIKKNEFSFNNNSIISWENFFRDRANNHAWYYFENILIKIAQSRRKLKKEKN